MSVSFRHDRPCSSSLFLICLVGLLVPVECSEHLEQCEIAVDLVWYLYVPSQEIRIKIFYSKLISSCFANLAPGDNVIFCIIN